MAATKEQQQLLSVLEDTATLLQKTHVNLKKCPKSRLTKGYIEARINIIDDYWKTFKDAHQQLVKITPKELKGTLPYFLNEEFFIYEDLYNVMQGDLKDMVSSMVEAQIEAKSMNSILNSSQQGGTVLHLPRIQIPLFHGNYEAWPAFKDIFTSLVHENAALGDVQKLHYLKTNLAGEAESLLRNIQVTSSNYLIAWDILNKRYGNKRLLLNFTMKRLFNQKKMTIQSPVHLKNLLDTTTECLNNLENLEIPTSSWDPIIIFLLVQKLDPETHKCWEEYAYRDESENLPTWSDFKKFIETKFRTLELVTANAREVKQVKERSFHVAVPETKKVCFMCNDNHTLCHCQQFIRMEPKERSEYVKNKHLCFNCLSPGHSVYRCKLPISCQICNRRHHSLLHETKNTEPVASTSTSEPLVSQHVVEEEEEEFQVNTLIASHLTTRQGKALLATAMVEISNEQGYTIILRALIDQGSQATFISERATQLLKLKRVPIKGSVAGVGCTKVDIKHMVQIQVRSRRDNNYSLSVQAYVMSKQLTAKIPATTITRQSWPHLIDLDLADPSYLNSGSIDLLLGVKEYVQILEQGLIKGPPGTPCAQKTRLGWILFGEICGKPEEDTYLVMHHQIDVDEILRSIWEIETDSCRYLTKEEKFCEELYEKTTVRNNEGRYVVKLPFKTESPRTPEGNTKEIAIQRFFQLERRFKRSSDLKNEYKRVIKDYIEEKHLEKVSDREKETKTSVYLPHHAVIRNDKETTKTRVVFDASCKGTNNISLNDELCVGPILQEDLRNLLMRWRMKCVGFIADIQKMYRQILVTKDDSEYQRVIWRDNENDELQEYRLLRVTFGTAPAPYLAVKTLHQVATDEGNGNPAAGQAIKNNFYMDDWLDGADSSEEAIVLAQDVTNILQRGGFNLTKWSSNNIDFMKSVEEDKRSANAHVDMNLEGTIKALGIVWNLSTDSFQYNLNLPKTQEFITKRHILSDVQKLFDPLGWIAPSTVMAKILIQKLWLERVNWDESISDTLKQEWKEIRGDFDNVHGVLVKRWLGTTEKNKNKIQIHGFSDASMRAYAAAVYIRIETSYGIVTRLIAAKTRVAPLKTISLPRLELCGALVLSKLMKQVGQAMQIPTSEMYAWTDSSIVLAWLYGEPNKWKPFVANRVVEIMENLNNKNWHHVQSSENPADLASRGMFLTELKTCDLWWKGPHWLYEGEIKISKEKIITTDMEMKTTKLSTYVNTEDQDNSFTKRFEEFNSLTELLKTITYCRRFLNYKKGTCQIDSDFTTDELEDSLTICIRRVQEEDFTDEIERLKTNKQFKRKSLLRSLNPFLDQKQILRVGGRLRFSNLPEDKKHPIILGHLNALTPLLVADAHAKTLHGGVQLMLLYLRSKYWIFKGKALVKKHIHRCLTCAKLNATSKPQIMGDLPEPRVTPTRPFLHSGLDFTGPFQILTNRGRGAKTVKAYVAIFICMSTKAIHIELVGDLTSESFIGAFRRFVSRRGKCNHLWSDQGRNFIGANKDLQEAFKEANLQFNGEIAQVLATDGTQWHFIPAYSPTFGGLWEAGVKSIKYHLRRILTTNLTFEEMTTILCQIEACLNSRPLYPIEDTDPNTVNVLTPGHFLIGDAPIIVPTSNMKDSKISHLSRWQHTQKLLNDFWRRWQDEYLSRLQQRPKWLRREKEFNIGDIVLIKNDNLPPGKWSLGRITDKHPGQDDLTRVYSVKSGNSVTKRTVTKLCALPIDTT